VSITDVAIYMFVMVFGTIGACYLIHWMDMLFWRFKRRRQLRDIFDNWKEPKH
jgi:hypothetical protein